MLVFRSNANMRDRDNHISPNIKLFANWSSSLPRIFTKHKIKMTTSTSLLTPVLRARPRRCAEGRSTTFAGFCVCQYGRLIFWRLPADIRIAFGYLLPSMCSFCILHSKKHKREEWQLAYHTLNKDAVALNTHTDLDVWTQSNRPPR